MRRTILLADDSPTIRRLVKQTFADSDFEIAEVSNGEAAIKLLNEMRPSIVLADIYMPGQNGYQVCTFIRNQPLLAKTPVVLLVGAFDAYDEEGARQAGATASMTKPFEPTALIELVASLLLPETEEAEASSPEPEDLLGLEDIFKLEPGAGSVSLITDTDIDRIADRVIQRLSSQVIESIAWEIVPDLTEKIVREELKRIR